MVAVLGDDEDGNVCAAVERGGAGRARSPTLAP